MTKEGDMQNGQKSHQFGGFQPVSDFIELFSGEVDWPRDHFGHRKPYQLVQALGLATVQTNGIVQLEGHAAQDLNHQSLRVSMPAERFASLFDAEAKRVLRDVIFSEGRRSENNRNTLLLISLLTDWLIELRESAVDEKTGATYFAIKSASRRIEQVLTLLEALIEDESAALAGDLFSDSEMGLLRALLSVSRIGVLVRDGFDNVTASGSITDYRRSFLEANSFPIGNAVTHGLPSWELLPYDLSPLVNIEGIV